MAKVEKKGTFQKFTYDGLDLDQLLDMSYEQLMQLYSARQRRRLQWGPRHKQHSLLKHLRKAKMEAPTMEKPEVVKTHLQDRIILSEMVGNMVGIYDGKTFNQVEIKPEMIGHYLGEFSITYKPVKAACQVLEPPTPLGLFLSNNHNNKKKKVLVKKRPKA